MSGLGRSHRRRGDDEGQISLYILGVALIAIMLIVVTYAITALALARTRLMDAADTAALAAANAFDEGAYTSRGVRTAVPVSDASVSAAATQSLAATALPPTFVGWWVDQGTGSPDGQTAQVVLSARVRLPLAGAILGDRASVGLTVESRARAATN